MKYFWSVILLACIGAGYLGYQYSLKIIPFKAMEQAEKILLEQAGGYNQVAHPPRPNADVRLVVRPSPDQLYSACIYDVSKGPVAISGVAPSNTYWSLSAFAVNSDNFFVVNDTELESQEFRYVLISEEMDKPVGYNDAQIIIAPTKKGAVLQRVFIGEEARAEEIDAQRKTMRCASL